MESQNVVDLPNEIWKDFPGFEETYQISNMGRVKQKAKSYVSVQKHLIVHPEELAKIQYSGVDPEPIYYPKVFLKYGNNFKVRLVHLVVAQLFVPNDDPVNKTQVYFLDGNKNNCRYDNLEWRVPEGETQQVGRYYHEIWKPVVGFEGLYEVSSCGRIRSTQRYVIGKDGKPQFKYSKILSLDEKQSKDFHNRGKYKRITLFKDGVGTHKSVHRLVAEAFIPNDDPEHKTEVDHKDGMKNNNHVDNLEWVTRDENRRRARQNGFISSPLKIHYGSLAPNAALTDDMVIKLRNEHNEGASIKELVDKYNLSHTTVGNCVRGLSYRTVEGPIRQSRYIVHGELAPNSKLTQEQAEEIRHKYNDLKLSIPQLCDEYGISHNTVYRIIHNKLYLENPYGPDAHEKNAHGNSLLDNGKVRQLRYDYAKGVSLGELKEKYGLSISSINSCVRGKTYKKCGGIITKDARHAVGLRSMCAKFTNQEDIDKIRTMWLSGVSVAKIAQELKVSDSTIQRIITRERYS